jgi:WD40 repeat protein
LKEANEWNEVIRYSPCEKYLAVGSHDNRVYVYEISEDGSEYKKYCTFFKNSSYITSFDWSLDSKVIRTTSGSHEKLYHCLETHKHMPDGLSSTKDMEWAT